jgi:hypothetical protein
MVVGDCTAPYKISGTDAATNINLSGANQKYFM